MCAFHTRAFFVARSISAARAAMAGKPVPPMPMPPGPICEELQRFLCDGPAPAAGEAPAAEGAPFPAGRMDSLFASATTRTDAEGDRPAQTQFGAQGFDRSRSS